MRTFTGPRPRYVTDDGFLLIEVLISTLLVALIVVATFTGFDDANRVSNSERTHDQASIIAAESQEQLRSDPATALEALQGSAHTYTTKLGGTTYTITETDRYINNADQATECSATGSNGTTSTNQNGDYIEITSSVSWPAQVAAKLPEVEQTSLVTPPTGSAIEVDATNDAKPEQPVSGVVALLKYTALNTTTPTTVTATTGPGGCVIFGNIPSTSAELAVTAPLDDVTPSGAFTVPLRQITIAPNVTVPVAYRFAQGGTIKATFTYKGATTFEGKPVVGETFEAANSKMEVTPEFIQGDTAYKYETGGEERYTPLSGTLAASAITPVATNYPTGNLFPFANKWTVYAGGCTSSKVTGESTEALVTGGSQTAVNVPMSYVLLNVYEGKTGTTIYAKELPVRITYTCASTTPADGATAAASTTQTQKTTTSGHLSNPFQPFGAQAVCVLYNSKNYTAHISSSTNENPEVKLYLGEGSNSEQTVESSGSSPC